MLLTKTTTAPVSATALQPCVLPPGLPAPLTLAGVGDAHAFVEAVWQRFTVASRAVGGGERTHAVAHYQRLSREQPAARTLDTALTCVDHAASFLYRCSPYRPTLRQVDANNSLALPELQGKRLDQTTAWIVEVSVTISPAGLAERPEPYAPPPEPCRNPYPRLSPSAPSLLTAPSPPPPAGTQASS